MGAKNLFQEMSITTEETGKLHVRQQCKKADTRCPTPSMRCLQSRPRMIRMLSDFTHTILLFNQLLANAQIGIHGGLSIVLWAAGCAWALHSFVALVLTGLVGWCAMSCVTPHLLTRACG